MCFLGGPEDDRLGRPDIYTAVYKINVVLLTDVYFLYVVTLRGGKLKKNFYYRLLSTGAFQVYSLLFGFLNHVLFMKRLFLLENLMNI